MIEFSAFSKLKITYTAVDGTNFETEDECAEHERFLEEKSAIVFDVIEKHISEIVTTREKRRNMDSVLEIIKSIRSSVDTKLIEAHAEGVSCAFSLYFNLSEIISKKEDLDMIEEEIGSMENFYGVDWNY